MDYPSSRSEAKRLGTKYYYTGKPCTRGHYSIRYQHGGCVECKTEDSLARKGNNYSQRTKESTYQWRERNRKKWRSYMKEYREKNRERISAQRKQYRKENKEKLQEYNRWHMENFYEVHIRKNNKRRAVKKQAYYPMDDDLLELVENEAADKRARMEEIFGIPFHIDHIVPLTSDYVCGLHCPFNLQVIPAEENINKGNYWWPDMPETLDQNICLNE